MRPVRPRKLFTVVVAATALALSGCAGGGSGSGPQPLEVVFIDEGNASLSTYMHQVAADYERAHPDVPVRLVPVKATESDYYTKVALMNRTPSTAPDVIWEDTFQVKADAAAGYLEPLDARLAAWPDWKQFVRAGRAGGRGTDGKQYGVPAGTDMQALWYNRALLKKAGVDVPWKPRSWADVRAAAKAVKRTSPGVTPLNVYDSKVGAEATSVRGVQTLLSGTGDSLYEKGRWVTRSPGLTQTLGFLRTLYRGGLLLGDQTTSDPNYSNIPATMLRSGKLAIDADGSFISNAWVKGGDDPWPQWDRVLGVAATPTRTGQEPGTTSMSGGWTWAVGARSPRKDAAFDWVNTATSKRNALRYALSQSNIPVRRDAAGDARYTGSNPTAEFFSSLIDVTHFRPAISTYPQVSNELSGAADAVTQGGLSPSAAVDQYDGAVADIVGRGATTSAGGRR